ncbi:pectinesterase family protein [Paenibacillus turpanensis]|uniref:pectinesterase family protein n=1 Tax=Paenibacillus turpanensis TaxID=2689078 RepID=UPI001407AC3C|nr:pectinesterase family protein [Paenibacillus turpanensis]
MLVAIDGSGDFQTIQEAIDQVPADNAETVTIRIRNGVYKEKIHIDKPFIHLVGEDAEKTVITYDDYAKKIHADGSEYGTFRSYSLYVGGDNFTAERLTIANAAGSGSIAGQALAAYVDADRAVFRQCRLLGHQDTLFTGPLPPSPMKPGSFVGPGENKERRLVRQYYEACYIEGDVDFIFGSATAVFQDCEIFAKRRVSPEDKAASPMQVHGWLTAPSTPEEAEYGYVFQGCRLTSDAPRHSYYFGRPWRNDAKAAFIDCWVGEHIRPEGWDNWNKPESEQTTSFCEFGNRGPGAPAEQRVVWAKQLSAEQAALYSPAQVLAGSDGWNPLQR